MFFPIKKQKTISYQSLPFFAFFYCHFAWNNFLKKTTKFPISSVTCHSYKIRLGSNYDHGKKTDALQPESIRFPEMLKRSVPLWATLTTTSWTSPRPVRPWTSSRCRPPRTRMYLLPIKPPFPSCKPKYLFHLRFFQTTTWSEIKGVVLKSHICHIPVQGIKWPQKEVDDDVRKEKAVSLSERRGTTHCGSKHCEAKERPHSAGPQHWLRGRADRQVPGSPCQKNPCKLNLHRPLVLQRMSGLSASQRVALFVLQPFFRLKNII